ncbi:hypothetical protein ABI59_00220 [Acidobacteria bacterium Mor1]|nr:hypothetical protein ABI59_00220 [Acidobacteria bacterium Mor1]
MRIFFYGLYMDAALLESMGYGPTHVGAARLDDFRLRIGSRATLIQEHGRASYGFLLDLPDEEASALYSRPEVAGYVPTQVQVTLLADSTLHPASCYLLATDEGPAEPNVEYASKLVALTTRLGLPAAYVEEIAAIARGC